MVASQPAQADHVTPSPCLSDPADPYLQNQHQPPLFYPKTTVGQASHLSPKMWVLYAKLLKAQI